MILDATTARGLMEVTPQTSLHNQPHLIASIIRPASLDVVAQVAEDIQEMREQLEKQTARWRELQTRKIAEPGEMPFQVYTFPAE